MSGGVSPKLVVVLLGACALAAASQLLVNGRRGDRGAAPDDQVELVVQEVARCGNGQAVLVLREKDGERRLTMPASATEAAAIDRRLHGEKADRPQLPDVTGASIHSLGGRVTRASIESVTTDKVFLGHLTVRGGAGAVDLESRAVDSVTLALEASAPIVVKRSLLEEAGILPSELSLTRGAAKARSAHASPPAPVHRI